MSSNTASATGRYVMSKDKVSVYIGHVHLTPVTTSDRTDVEWSTSWLLSDDGVNDFRDLINAGGCSAPSPNITPDGDIWRHPESSLRGRTAAAMPDIIRIIYIGEGAAVAKPNYQFQKRQKELKKKKKMEEKRQRKLEKNVIQSEENPDQFPDQSEAVTKDEEIKGPE